MKSRITRLHPAQLHLLEQLDQRIRLSDRGDRPLKSLFAGFHDQFMEQEPGPRGSPQLPQAPDPLDVVQLAVAPTPKAENCFASLVVLHFGQPASVAPCTNNSNR